MTGALAACLNKSTELVILSMALDAVVAVHEVVGGAMVGGEVVSDKAGEVPGRAAIALTALVDRESVVVAVTRQVDSVVIPQ